MRGGYEYAAFDQNLVAHFFGADRAAPFYLHSYLSDLGAASVLVERHYVDRHFVDDFVTYYARSFATPNPHCLRLHFFRGLDPTQLEALTRLSCTDPVQRNETEQALQEAYLGFVVRRPLRGAHMGRTVLQTYPSDGGRHYEVVRPYRVHLAGCKLSVNGLAYQQQDQGAAVCASTALWCALQRVAFIAGHRTPTPSEITKAAHSPFPAEAGLNFIQMAEALSTLGYVAEWFTPADNRALFRARVAACLRSQLPVILTIVRVFETPNKGRLSSGHAVTVTGYCEPAAPAEVFLHPQATAAVGMRTAALQTLYVHDDNLGSHAHYEFEDSMEVDELGNPRLSLFRGDKKRTAKWWPTDTWHVLGALVPKAPKMRLSMGTLLRQILGVRPLLQRMYPGMDIHFDVRLCSGVEYRSEILTRNLDPAGLYDFVTGLSLPRHIGVVEAYHGQVHLLDVLVDISEVSRQEVPAILGIVAPGVGKNDPPGQTLANVAKAIQCGLITAA
jgi:hypothetical protein